MALRLTMDGAEISIGDRVYVMLHGGGVVTSIRTNGMIMIKTPKGESGYPANAYSGPERRVFWHNPVLIVPPKHTGIWDAYRDISVMTFEKLLQLCRSGAIILPSDSDTEAIEEVQGE